MPRFANGATLGAAVLTKRGRQRPELNLLACLRRGTLATRRTGLVAALVTALAVVGVPASSSGERVGAATTQAATVPAGFVDAQVATGLSNPTVMAIAPDGRIFVAQQAGAVRVIKNGALLATPFVSITLDSQGERGLLGITFDPSFATNGYVYVYYTALTPTVHNRVSRFTANGDVAVAGSETTILELETLTAAQYHNGGALHFGLDGRLYVAVGDNTVRANAQLLTSTNGKMLRINRDGTIPTDNPFYAQTTGIRRAIWARGLRNPFTFATQPSTSRILINDVGENTWEEINDGIAGSNYGWPTTEGPTTDPQFRGPAFAYDHTQGCSIAGGAFYNPPLQQFPASYVGDYFFADYCGGWIRKLELSNNSVTDFATGIDAPVDVRVGPDGVLYYLSRGSGEVRKISASSSGAPQITQQPVSVTKSISQSASFSITASGTAPLSYQWQRNGVNIAGATAATYSIASVTASDNGARLRAQVSNGAGSAISTEATLTVLNSDPPISNIYAPAAGTLYTAGQTISYGGTASDRQEGPLAGSRFTWRVDFHHDTHSHPFIPATTGSTTGSFTVPTSGELSPNTWYRIHLTVVDATGLTYATYRDITPRKSTFTLATSPTGLNVTLDGTPRLGPYSVTGVVGLTRNLGVVSPQVLNGKTYVFASWSDGGAASHSISTPAANTTYTATFVESGAGSGLKGEYFDNMDFTGTLATRTDATVNFSWGTGAPVTGFGVDRFSARWTGQVLPRFSQTYTFYTTSDDGVRLWVNGQQVINNWTNHAPTENSGTITLVAGTKYDIRMEFFENSGGATAILSWSSPSVPKQVIPSSQLSPTTGPVVPFSATIRSVSTGKAYTTTTAQTGATVFIDRTYTVSSIAPALAGGVMVRAANDDKSVATNPHLTIDVNQNATIYVAFDSRATGIPAWLNDGTWTRTSLVFVGTYSTPATIARVVYSKAVNAGTVSLGGNAAPNAVGMYTVVAKPR